MRNRMLCILLTGVVILGFANLLFGQQEMIVVLKDGSRQSFRMADVARVEFGSAANVTQSPAVDFLKPDKVITRGASSAFEKVKTPMTLHGRVASLFVLQHPGTEGPTEAIYNLGGRANRLTAMIGIDQSMAPSSQIQKGATVEYLIYADGRLAWASGTVTHQTPIKNVDVSLTGVNELKLVVTDGGDGNFWDWAVWADPVIR